MKRALRKLFKQRHVYRLGQKIMFSLVAANPQYQTLFRSEPSVLGAVIPGIIGDDELVAQLKSIPSETTMAERMFLYSFMANIWDGRHDVLEIGPFLGGTTRALAMGMLRNARREGQNELLTFDRFQNYYDLERLAAYIQPMIERGALTASILTSIGESAEFLDLFNAIHKDQPYGHILQAREGVLPSSDTSELNESKLFKLEADSLFNVVFVDGCKSWYGTRYFMQETMKHVAPGAYFIFQDYAWFTCFWIPAFVHLLSRHFDLVAYVDSTYAFQVKDLPDESVINEAFPGEPGALGVEGIAKVFNDVACQAQIRHDRRGYISACLQKAYAFAQLGERNKASEEMVSIQQDAYAVAGYEGLVNMANDAIRRG